MTVAAVDISNPTLITFIRIPKSVPTTIKKSNLKI
jgi:hypothetical protein